MSKPTVNSLVTEIATSTVVDAISTSATQKGKKRSSTGSGRRTRDTIYNLTSSISKVHRVVHPSSADYDDDDDDNDDDDDDDDDQEEDEDVEDMKEGDEPLPQQHHDQTASDQAIGTSSGVAPSSAIKDARDPTAARYHLLPEKIQPENKTTSTGVAQGQQTGARSSPALAPAIAKPKTTTTVSPATTTGPSMVKTISPSDLAVPVLDAAASVSKAKAVLTGQAHPELSTTKPLPTTITTPASTPAPTSHVVPASAATTARVDPLAPTAAAPHGYKIVTVKKPDGTIAKVKRPLKEGEKLPVPVVKKTTSVPTKPTAQSLRENSAATGSTIVPTFSAMNEKVTLGLSSTAPRIVGSDKEIEAAPIGEGTSTTTKLPEVSEKELGGVRITEKELERGISPQKSATPDDRFKGARKLARIMKLFIWTVSTLR